MTLDALRAYGANVDEGMGRCLNDEPFYLEMVSMALADGNFDKLRAAMDAGDARTAFAAAHSLKGSVGNVALTPIYEPVCALTEALREDLERVDFLVDVGIDFLRDLDAVVDALSVCEDAVPAPSDEGTEDERDDGEGDDHDGLDSVFWRQQGLVRMQTRQQI